jgi:fucose 4-O-acetylase-like acetyltransferase
MKEFFDNWKLIILLCLTLGLAPFFPEPHLWGKLKWVAGGAVGMEAMDWFDFLFHGFPFLLLIRIIALSFFKK